MNIEISERTTDMKPAIVIQSDTRLDRAIAEYQRAIYQAKRQGENTAKLQKNLQILVDVKAVEKEN